MTLCNSKIATASERMAQVPEARGAAQLEGGFHLLHAHQHESSVRNGQPSS